MIMQRVYSYCLGSHSYGYGADRFLYQLRNLSYAGVAVVLCSTPFSPGENLDPRQGGKLCRYSISENLEICRNFNV